MTTLEDTAKALDGKSSRRGFLGAAGAIGATALGGCITNNGGNPDPGNTPTQTETPTETETPAETETQRFPDSGQIKPVLNEETPWPNQFFQGDVEIPIELTYHGERHPPQKDQLQKGDTIHLTAQEMRETYHWNQYQTIADQQNSELLRQFPTHLTDPDWLDANIYNEAHEDGTLPEFQDSTIHVHPDHLKYELASEVAV